MSPSENFKEPFARTFTAGDGRQVLVFIGRNGKKRTINYVVNVNGTQLAAQIYFNHEDELNNERATQMLENIDQHHIDLFVSSVEEDIFQAGMSMPISGVPS